MTRSAVGMYVTLVALATVFAVGLYLRVWAIDDQVLEDDEYHTLHVAATRDAGYILTQRHSLNYCIPLALYDRAMMLSLGLDEVTLRIPVVVAGLMLSLLATLAAWRLFGRLEALVVAWLFATSPILLLYSRFARPYGIVALLVLLASLGMERCARRGRLMPGLCSSACGALAVLFHLLSAPAVFAIWVYGIASSMRGPHAKVPRLAVAIGFLLTGVLLAPTIPEVVDLARANAGAGVIPRTTWWETGSVLLGTPSTLLIVWLLALAALGVAAPRPRQSTHLRLVWILIATTTGISLLLIRPKGATHPIVIGRYAISVLPGLLILVALGISAQVKYLGRILPGKAGRLASALPLVPVVLLPLTGSLPEIYRAPNAFTNDRRYYEHRMPVVEPDSVPPVYRFLSQREDVTEVIEAPWVLRWAFLYYGHYQRVHGRQLTIGTTNPVFETEGVAFKRLVPARVDGSEFDSGTVVVVHKDPLGEFAHLWHRARLEAKSDRNPNIRQHYRRTAQAALDRYHVNPRLHLAYEDGRHAIFAGGKDLARAVAAWHDSLPQ